MNVSHGDRIQIDGLFKSIRALASQAAMSLPAHQPACAIARATIDRPIDYMRCAEFDAILRDVDIQPGMTVLDVASPQWLVLHLAKQFPTASFVYINILGDEIEPFKQIRAACAIRNLEYVVGDVRQSGFASQIFDRVISVSVLEHVAPEIGGDYTAFAEIRRILRREGALVITLPFKARRNVVYVEGAAFERSTQSKNFYAREYDQLQFEALVRESGFHLRKATFVSERRGLLSPDYYEWGPGKDQQMARYSLGFRRRAERMLHRSLDRMLAQHYLRLTAEPHHRLVNIAASLQPR